MQKDHKTIAEQEIAHAAGKFLSEEANRSPLITVTRANVSPDMANSTIFVSVFPESDEESALDFLKRKRSDFRDWVAHHVRLKKIPFFDFALDIGEKNRQVVQDL